MNPREHVRKVIEEYKREIVSELDRGNYQLASIQLGSLYVPFQVMSPDRKLELIATVKQGLNFIGSLGALVESTKEDSPNPGRINNLRMCLEAFAAQTTLPI